MKQHNFSAGPAILPQEVFEKASQAILEFDNTGLSIIEMSHRDKRFVAVMEKARALAVALLGLEGKGYHSLFLQGGAGTQFIMTAYNLLEHKAAYLDTGSWANKAIKEAKIVGDVNIISSSKDKNYNYIPKGYDVPPDVDYFHVTTNNTIFGTQLKADPDFGVPVVADMSSDIFSCERDFSKYDIIYAGAQKNMGPAGTTLVVIREDILGKVTRLLPSILDYRTHINAKSMYNTPPVFAVYTSMLVLEWLNSQGGIKSVEKNNIKKASLIYDEIERNALFKSFAEKEDRSMMNVTFNLTDERHKERFENLLKDADISGLPGHRSVGGYRASIYNAMPMESVIVLVDVMKQFEKSL